MTRLPTASSTAKISVSCTQRGDPLRLTWGSQRFVVERITDAWRVDTDWWLSETPISRHYFTLTTTAGALLVIYHDYITSNWFLEQAYD